MKTRCGGRQHKETYNTDAYLAADEQDAFVWVGEILDYQPTHNFITQESYFQHDTEATVEDLSLDNNVPDSANQPYDMLEVIAIIVDDGALLQVQERYAPNIIVGLGRVEGLTVGVVANQPQ